MRKIRLAYLDNTLPRKKTDKNIFAGGETDDRLMGLRNAGLENVSIDPVIIDPYPFPLNPLRNCHGIYSGIDPLRALKVLLKFKHYDAVFCVGESSALSFLMLKSFLGINIPVLVLDPALSLGWRPRKKILDFVIPRADTIIVFGKNQSKFIENQWGHRCNCEFIYHGIDSNFYKPELVEEENYIFSIGNDVGRDFSLLIESTKNIDTKLIIKTNTLEIDNSVNKNKVEILKNRISFEELKKLYAKSKVVVVPLHDCHHASGVNSVLESMAMGKATIVSGSDGILDYVVNKETAIVVEPGNKKCLEKAIRNILEKPEEGKRLGKNAREFILKNCDSKIYNKKLAKIISSSCKKN